MKSFSIVIALSVALFQVGITNAQSDDADQNRVREQIKAPSHLPSAAEMRARMEELRKKDPARYVQMTNRIARFQASRRQRSNDRLAALSSVDTSGFTAEERQTHETLLAAIARREELNQRIYPQTEGVTEEQRNEAFEELRKLEEKMRNLEARERDSLLLQTARSFGLSSEKSRELVEAIKNVYQATTSGNYRSGPRRKIQLQHLSRKRD